MRSKRSKGRRIDKSSLYLEYTIGHDQPVFQWLLKVQDLFQRFDEIRTTLPETRIINVALAAAAAAFLESILRLSEARGTDGSYRFLEYTIDPDQPVFRWLLRVDHLLQRFGKIRARHGDVRVVDTALAAAGAAFLESILGLPDPKVSTSPPEGIPRRRRSRRRAN